MGNKIARTTQVSASEYYLHDLPSSYNLVLLNTLGRGRFFKSILCKHDEGSVLVKVYFKRGDPIDLKEYERRLSEIREIFHNVQHRHLWPFQFWLETDKAAYLLRQYFFSNLHDRLSTRPFLSLIEKKWLSFQLLCAVKQSHENGVCHGDIKCENVLVTSWNWIYLADFASFKPTYIPDDDPSDFSFFFDTGGRRRCYLAPERFYEHGGEMQVQHDAPLKPSMDVFSLGCVIAELFLEGQPLFELSQLLAYRRGQYDPCQFLEKIPDTGIRKMILHMIQLDPESRLSCENYLQEYGSVVFPSYFTPFLHKFFSCMIPVDSDTRVAVTQGAFQEIHKQMMNERPREEITPKTSESCELTESATKQRIATLNRILPDKHELEKGMTAKLQLISEISSLLKDVEQQESVKLAPESDLRSKSNIMFTHDTKLIKHRVPNQPLLTLSMGYKEKGDYCLKRILKNDLKTLMDVYSSKPDTSLSSFFPGNRCILRCEGMILVASLICSSMRTVKQPQLRRGAILMLMLSSLHIDDEDLLQHVIPYIIAMLSDSVAIVRCAALEALCNILPLVQDFPPSDSKIFPEYILPMLSTLPDDQEESVRICYASNIFKIALTAYRFLVSSNSLNEVDPVDIQILPSKSSFSATEKQEKKQMMSLSNELAKLRRSIAEIVQELVMGSKNTPNIRRALLQDIGHLCYFFGQRQCNDFLLPILPAFLNDHDEQLRADFYGQIVFVCFFVGQRSVEEYLLPYIEQAINDEMEVVIVNALECLAMLCKSRLLGKRILLDMIERAFPLLCYPILWVRRAAVNFIAAVSESLGPVDSNIYLFPVLRPFLHRKPTSLSSDVAILSCLKPPVSKLVFYQVLQNARGSDMLERQRKIWYNSGNKQETIEQAKHNQFSKESLSQASKCMNASLQDATASNAEDATKSRTLGSTLRNFSSTLDDRDSFSSDRMHFSGFISAHISDGNSLLRDRPSEGIPVYSYSMGKRSTASASAKSDASLQWNSLGISSLSTPLSDPVSRSFVLSSTDHPKLISGSIYNISNASKRIPISLEDTETQDNDQSSHITSKFHDVSVSDALKGASSIPAVDTPQSDVSGLTSPVRASCVPDSGWRPRGVLVAHLQEHKSSVNDIAISNDNSFFVSVSDDSTVKIWDTRKLEKDISFRSRLTYHLDGTKALCTTMLRGSSQVVIGAGDGTIHLFSVDYVSRGGGSIVERYSGISDIKKKQDGEGAILSVLNCSADSSISQTVLYSTQLCGVRLWDTRTESTSWRFKAAPDEGYVSSLVMGGCGNWFVSGSSRGVLTLWDMRFLLPVKSWRYSRVCPIENICLFIPPMNSTVSATGRPLIYVAAGCDEVSLWNAENGSCHQVFKVAGCEGDAEISSSIPWALMSSANKSSSKQKVKRTPIPKYSTDELNEPPPRLPGVRGLLPLPGGDLLTGGTDLKIHYWDHSSPDRSFCICGPSTKGVGPEVVYDTQFTFGIQVVQETSKRPAAPRLTQKALLAVAATDSAGCHCDSVLSLASVKLNQRLLISSSRDGAIKVWK